MHSKRYLSLIKVSKMEQLEREFQDLKAEVLDIKKLLMEREPPTDTNTREILTAERTMEILECSRNTFDRLRKAGKIKVYQLNRRLYCKYSEILLAIENGLLEPVIH